MGREEERVEGKKSKKFVLLREIASWSRRLLTPK